eukprot:c22627_g1_i2 orf=457-2211(+)
MENFGSPIVAPASPPFSALTASILKPGIAIPPAEILTGNWSSTYRWITIAGGFIAFALACMGGANDVPTFFGASVGSGALSLPQSVALACVMEFTGAIFMGNRTVDALQSSVLKERPDAGLFMWGFIIALIGATIWLAFATYLEMPVSSSLSIQGAIIGVSVTTKGLHSIYWSKHNSNAGIRVGGVLAILLSWIVGPSIAAAAGFLFFGFMKLVLLRSHEAEQRTLQALPFYYGTTVLVLTFFIIYRGSPRTNLHEMAVKEAALIAVASAVLASILAFLIIVPLARKRLGKFNAGREQKLDVENNNVSDAKEESDSFPQKEVTAEDLLQQFNELRVLDTVYEGDEEEEADNQSPQNMVKCSPICGPNSLPLKQLLARTPNRFNFKRLRRPQNLTIRQKFFRFMRRLKASTFGHKIEYNRDTLVQHALAEKFDDKAEELFSFLQILTACVSAFGHGSNDVVALVNPYAATLNIYGHRHALSNQNVTPDWNIDMWLLALGGIGVGLGFAAWGWKLVRCLGGRLTFLSPSRGFSVQICSIATVLVTWRTGLPVSSTHIFVGAILGVAAADSIKAWPSSSDFLTVIYL